MTRQDELAATLLDAVGLRAIRRTFDESGIVVNQPTDRCRLDAGTVAAPLDPCILAVFSTARSAFPAVIRPV